MMRLERVLRRHLDGLEQSALRRRNAVQAEYDDPKITVHKRRQLGVPYALAIEAHGRLRYLRQVLLEYPELPDLFAWFVRWHTDATELELVRLGDQAAALVSRLYYLRANGRSAAQVARYARALRRARDRAMRRRTALAHYRRTIRPVLRRMATQEVSDATD